MSAPPPRPPVPPVGQNGKPTPPPGVLRRAPKPKVDPFARRKPRPQPLMARPPTKNYNNPSGAPAISELMTGPGSDRDNKKLRELVERRKQNRGWSEAPPAGVQVGEFKLMTTKQELLRGIRYHVMRFNRSTGDKEATKGSAEVDPTQQDQFPRPVSLHRRDPRLPPAGKMQLNEDDDDAAEDAEAERARQIKADRDAQRAIDQAQIAPVTKRNEAKPKNGKKEKAAGFYSKMKEEQVKQKGLRYEETLPWHIEDADGKNVWAGSYIAGLSEVNCAFYIEGGAFKMLPLERFYKFDEKPHFNTLTLEEAEKAMKEEGKITRWMMADKAKDEEKAARDEYRTYLGGRPRVKTESATSRAVPKSERADDFDIDMEGDEFQDDDENPGFEADDEDTKEAKDRVRRDHLKSNLFGEGDEEKVEKERKEAEKAKKERRKLGKQTVRGLTKHEHAMDYADNSDSEDADNNPFTESSESESEPEQDKKDEESKKLELKDQLNASLSKGNGTSGAKKASDAAKKGKSLKRPGSPNLSDSSENETTRKKVKTETKSGVKGPSSLAPSRSTTPMPGRKGAGGAASDGEGSDGGGHKGKDNKPKAGGGATGTPGGSRAGSPNPAANKATSPAKPAPSAAAPMVDRIQPQEVVDAIAAYPKGIKISGLLKLFQHRLDKPGTTTRGEWIQMVKQYGSYVGGELRPKGP